MICGIQPVRHLLEQQPERIVGLWVQADIGQGRLARIADVLGRFDGELRRCPAGELARLAEGGRHQGVVAELADGAPLDDAGLDALLDGTADPFLLLLDGVQDPRNLGACLRTANAAGVTAVVAGRSRSVGLTPAASKAAAGAAELQPLALVANLARCMAGLKARGIVLVGTDPAADEVFYEIPLTGPVGLVLGSEGEGLRQLTRRHCDRLVRLPMAGAVESLNVSVAAGICLYEAVRQRSAARVAGAGPLR
ncbi:MAG: 23S rRNA (guanosine(2251)-2'-O)-methyltransferase RlmB [Chromatiales bacterium]|nr:23S rRNA (guanosine(2251)-2'-O)-methyltransferase RlmB [Chromatiales bacterium]